MTRRRAPLPVYIAQLWRRQWLKQPIDGEKTGRSKARKGRTDLSVSHVPTLIMQSIHQPCDSHDFSHLPVFNRRPTLILTSVYRIEEEYLCILGTKRLRYQAEFDLTTTNPRLQPL
jgi:hypothetical protein